MKKLLTLLFLTFGIVNFTKAQEKRNEISHQSFKKNQTGIVQGKHLMASSISKDSLEIDFDKRYLKKTPNPNIPVTMADKGIYQSKVNYSSDNLEFLVKDKTLTSRTENFYYANSAIVFKEIDRNNGMVFFNPFNGFNGKIEIFVFSYEGGLVSLKAIFAKKNRIKIRTKNLQEGKYICQLRNPIGVVQTHYFQILSSNN